MSRLPDLAGDRPKKRFKTYPIGYFHIAAFVREGRLYLFVAGAGPASSPMPRWEGNPENRGGFPETLKIVPYRVHTVLTDNESSSHRPGTAPARFRDTAFTCSTGSATSMASSTG